MEFPLCFTQKKVCGQPRFYAVDPKVHKIMAELLCKVRIRPRKAFNLSELLALQQLGCSIALITDGKQAPLNGQ